MSLTIQSSRFIHLALDCRIDLAEGGFVQEDIVPGQPELWDGGRS